MSEKVQEALEANQAKALAVAQQNSAVALNDADPDFDPSLAGQVDQADILIPKLLLMQGTSKLVQKELVAMGSVIDSVTKEEVITKSETLEIIPLTTFKSIDVSLRKPGEKQFKFVQTLPFDGKTALLAKEEETSEGTVQRMHAINVYVLRRDQINDPSAMPYLIKFKSTGYKIGKEMVNHFTKSNMLKKNPYHKTLILGVDRESNDENTWYVFSLKSGKVFDRSVDGPILAACKEWAKITLAGSVKVDSSDEAADAAPMEPQAEMEVSV